LKAEATTHPLGNPSLPFEKEKAFRRKCVERALWVLQQNIDTKTVFD
jgi:hypothetical protein